MNFLHSFWSLTFLFPFSLPLFSPCLACLEKIYKSITVWSGLSQPAMLAWKLFCHWNSHTLWSCWCPLMPVPPFLLHFISRAPSACAELCSAILQPRSGPQFAHIAVLVVYSLLLTVTYALLLKWKKDATFFFQVKGTWGKVTLQWESVSSVLCTRKWSCQIYVVDWNMDIWSHPLTLPEILYDFQQSLCQKSYLAFSWSLSVFIPRSPSSKRQATKFWENPTFSQCCLTDTLKSIPYTLTPACSSKPFPTLLGKSSSLDRAESCTEVRLLPAEWELSVFSSYPKIAFATRHSETGNLIITMQTLSVPV